MIFWKGWGGGFLGDIEARFCRVSGVEFPVTLSDVVVFDTCLDLMGCIFALI